MLIQNERVVQELAELGLVAAKEIADTFGAHDAARALR